MKIELSKTKPLKRNRYFKQKLSIVWFKLKQCSSLKSSALGNKTTFEIGKKEVYGYEFSVQVSYIINCVPFVKIKSTSKV